MPTASARDTARVLSTVLLPIVARGPIVRRARVVALAERLDADRRAGRLLRQLRARYGPAPLRLRVPGRPLALVLSPQDVKSVLLGSPEPYTPANREKVAALVHFQPHGVLISQGPIRAQRRLFNEAVLDTGRSAHRHAEAIEAVIQAEAQLPARLTWAGFSGLWWRIVRQVVLGRGARDDTVLTEQLTALRSDANWAYLWPRRDRLRRRFEQRLRRYLDRAEPGSLAQLVAATPAGTGLDPAGQVPHWLFAFDAAGIAAYRALALLSAEPSEVPDRAHLEAAVLESVRLWPTTMVIVRDSTRAIGEYPAGTGFLILPSFFQRDPALPYADRYTPEIWLDGRARDNWHLVPFSAGPARCPGRELVLQMTGALLSTLLDRYRLGLVRPGRLDAQRPLPSELDHTSLRFCVAARQPAATSPSAQASGSSRRTAP